MYIPPAGSAIGFAFDRRRNIPPGPSATNFAFGAPPEVVYPPPPGVIVNVGTPWRPSPDRKFAVLAARYTASLHKDVDVSVPGPDADNPLDICHVFAHANAEQRAIEKAALWNPVPDQDGAITLQHEDAAHRDIERTTAPWRRAGVRLELDINAPFLVMTPWKDLTHHERFASSDIFSRLRRRNDTLPGQLAKPTLGVASLSLDRRWNVEEANLYPLSGTFGEFAIQPKDSLRTQPWGVGTVIDGKKHLPWGPAGARDTTLDFDYDDYPGPIEFPNTFTIPTLRFYVVANSAQIVRVSDGKDVPASSVSLSISSDQYTWNFRAALAKKSAKALIEGTDGEPVEVDVHINNHSWRVLVDLWDESEAWARNTINISGRSRSAFLAAPYATPRDYTEASGLLAQQLAAQELPFGWDLEWNATDWFVPAGAWRYQGLTPIQAVGRLAAAAGAYLQPHPVDDKLVVESLYPEAPWNLDSLGPDFQMPRHVMLQRSSRKVPGSGANGVYVFGGSVSPYHAEVIRRLSNGLPLAPQVVNELVTDRNPAEALGIVALAETGRQALESYELPLSDALGGLIGVGSLVEIGKEVGTTFLPDWRGLIRAVTVNAAATRASNGGVALKVRQTVDMVRHYDEDV